jgi:cellulose synthase/poly-beta-1,6-N-acetylglucosamine synthase-like glycosyltransferase
LASAVAGSVRVLRPSNLVQLYQDLEYSLGDVQKSFLSQFGSVNIIPGPAGLFRKSALQSIDGYETNNETFAEDTELTLRLLADRQEIIFEPRMCSSTQAPQDLQTLMRQRYRWNRGIYQALRKNIDRLFHSQKTYFSWYLLFEKVWTPVVDFCLLIFLVGQFICTAKMDLFVSYNIFIFIMEVTALGMTHLLSRRSRIDHVVTLFISRFTLSILITTWKFLCLQEEWGRKQMTWDKLERQTLKPLVGKT